jgi:hypothetical protein
MEKAVVGTVRWKMAGKGIMVFDKDKEYIFRCTCHGPHFLSVAWWEDDKEIFDGYFTLEGMFGSSKHRLWHRLKEAWQLIRSGHADTWVEIDLDSNSTAQQLAEVLTEYTDRQTALRKEQKGNEEESK